MKGSLKPQTAARMGLGPQSVDRPVPVVVRVSGRSIVMLGVGAVLTMTAVLGVTYAGRHAWNQSECSDSCHDQGMTCVRGTDYGCVCDSTAGRVLVSEP